MHGRTRFFYQCSYSFTGVGLPIDPSLLAEGEVTLPHLPPLRGWAESSAGAVSDNKATLLVAEGLPLIAAKLVEKIQRWEFIDLSLLLHDPSSKSDELLLQQQGRVMIVQSVEQAQRRKQITDIFAWTKAFAIYNAALLSAESTSKEEVVGLWCHMHLINQLSRDLGGGQWLSYDSEFREWAAAKGVRKWGDINMAIYGKCLSGRIALTMQLVPPTSPSIPRSSNRPRVGQSPVCYQWNFTSTCEKGEANCRFSHSCYHCGSPHHRGKDCREGNTRSKKAKVGETLPMLPAI